MRRLGAIVGVIAVGFVLYLLGAPQWAIFLGCLLAAPALADA